MSRRVEVEVITGKVEVGMQMNAKDREILRPLAERYAEIANLPIQQERMERYRKINALECVRPPLLVSEVPWGEIHDDALTCQCSPEFRGIECNLRRALYQWDHFQGDMVIPPAFRVGKVSQSTGIGVSVEDTQIKSETGTNISAHEYVNLIWPIMRRFLVNVVCSTMVAVSRWTARLTFCKSGSAICGKFRSRLGRIRVARQPRWALIW